MGKICSDFLPNRVNSPNRFGGVMRETVFTSLLAEYLS